MCDTMERGPARTAPVIRDTGGQRSEVYFYPDVKEIQGTEEWELKETTAGDMEDWEGG